MCTRKLSDDDDGGWNTEIVDALKAKEEFCTNLRTQQTEEIHKQIYHVDGYF